jgi:hypothetical protein
MKVPTWEDKYVYVSYTQACILFMYSWLFLIKLEKKSVLPVQQSKVPDIT